MSPSVLLDQERQVTLQVSRDYQTITTEKSSNLHIFHFIQKKRQKIINDLLIIILNFSYIFDQVLIMN